MSDIKLRVVPSPFYSIAGRVVITLPPMQEFVSDPREYAMTRLETESLIEALSATLYSNYLKGKISDEV